MVKIVEFFGNKGYVSLEDVEMWFRSVVRVIRINKWSVDEVFEYV